MRSILNDISISELMTMRTEQGMSNQEIADAVGCSYHTIRKLLGKQPKGIRGERTFTAPRQAIEHHSEPAKDEFYPAALVLAERCLTLQGEIGRYEIDTYAKVVRIHIADQGVFALPLDGIATLHNELSAILRDETRISFCTEAW